MIKYLSDPIYHFVKLKNHELKVLDSVSFQRLRYVKQLGVAYLVFPSAQHTRFEHSVGVLELATRIYDSLGLKDERTLELVRLAGLLHDIGHPPFSHTTEVLLGDKGHEEVGYAIITDGEIKDVLRREGFSQEEIERVARIAFKKPKDAEEELLSKIITGELGADRMDYLRRDAYFCGTSYGFFDYERILTHMEIRDKNKVFNKSALRAIESFFLGRYFMYVQVYFHKVVRILNTHLIEFIEEFFGRERFLKESLTDADVISLMLKNPNHPTVRRLMAREHFREVFSTNSFEEFERVKKELLSRYEEKLLRFDKVSKKVLDEDTLILHGDRLLTLRESSDLINSMKDIEIYRIYADKGIKDEVREFIRCLG